MQELRSAILVRHNPLPAAAAVLVIIAFAGELQPAASGSAAAAECFVASRLDRSSPVVSDVRECAHKTAPASTFKIPHALIALQTGVIKADTVFTWDGTRYAFESWRRNHDLDSAIKSSVYPIFQRTAAAIGRARMHQRLSALGYAADGFDGDIATFWNDGDLLVSPLEQLAFLQRFFRGALPIDERHRTTVRDALHMPAGHIVNAAGVHPFALAWPAATIVRAKTGNTTVNGERVSWLVGELELERVEYVFVARARSGGALDTTAGADVARHGLNALERK